MKKEITTIQIVGRQTENRKIKCSACKEMSKESGVIIDVINHYVYCPKCWESHLEINKTLNK